MKGVKIIEANIEGDIFPLCNNIDEINENFYTVVIGSNATGKSRLLVNILNTLRQVSNNRLKSKGLHCDLKLNINNDAIRINNKDESQYKGTIENINLISISNSLFDKFPHQAKSDSNYSYVGSRMVGFSTHKRAIVNDLMDVFSENLDDKKFISKAKELFKFLKIPPVINLSLRISRLSNRDKLERLLYNATSPEKLKEFLFKISQQGFYRQQSKKINSLVNDDFFIEGFYNYLNTGFRRLQNNSHRDQIEYKIDLRDESSNISFIEEYKYFSVLRRLNFLTYEYIKLRKNGFEYDILDSSTGEIGLLTTFIRAIPEMKSNSVIFIDEPELSLHPSWQMKYIELLQKFLKGYSGCHIFIATHSHLLLSDLREKWSDVLVLRNENGKVKSKLLKHTPFGWSPEAILYEVFQVSTVRNHYFEYDLRQLLSLISNRSKDKIRIKEYIEKFKSFNYSSGDPLELIIKEAEEYVKN